MTYKYFYALPVGVLAFFSSLAVAASALAINSKTHLSLAFDPTASVTSASPSIGSTITPQGVLSNQQTIISTLTPIANGVVELWDVTANKSIATATTNNDGKYQAVLKITCNKNFNMEARFAGTSDYLPETSNQVTITPTGGSSCASGQDPYQVVSTAPPTATGSSSSSGNYIPLVQIPNVNTTDFLQYLSGIYNFLISIVGILAMASLVYGGFRYLTSVGNPAAVEDAKDIINSAIIGLVLALTSWLILNEINPDVLVLKKPGQIGGTSDKYAYGQTSFAKCFTNVDDPGYGTQANPCRCVDGTEQYTTKTRTSLTLNVAPLSVSIGGTVTASGKLTDATGAGIAGKSIGIIISNSAVNGSGSIPSTGGLLSWLGLGTTITTGSGGNFSIPLGPSKCVATEQWQAVFDAKDDSFYLPSGSGIVSVTTNPPGTSCTQGDYPVKSVATFMSSNTCQSLCSNKNAASDSQFHCLAPRLGVGRTAEDAMSGRQTIDNPPATTSEPIFFDATSNTKTGFPIGEIDVSYSPGWSDWLTGTPTYNYQCALNGGCKGSSVTTCTVPVSPDQSWTTLPYKNDKGKFIHTYPNAGTYPVGLKIGVKMPDGTCEFKTESNAIIKVQ